MGLDFIDGRGVKVFHTQRVEDAEVGDVVVAEGEEFFDFRFSGGELHVGDVDLGDFAGNVIAAFDLLEVLGIGAVDAVVDIVAFLGGEEVGVGDADLRHDGDGLRVGAVFFSFDLFVQSAVAADLLRELEEVVGGTDTHFAPAVVVEVAVVNFVVVIEDFDVREHGDDGLAGFENVHVALHVHFKEFGGQSNPRQHNHFQCNQ